MKYAARITAGSGAISSSPEQGDLFGGADTVPDAAAAPDAAVLPHRVAADVESLAARWRDRVHWGTSSWHFPGWAGIVYQRAYAAATLTRDGLAAYAAHPLLNAVSLDRSFYAAVPRDQLRRYAAMVPKDFRFVAKAYSGLTTPPDVPRPAHLARAAGVYLDAEFASREVIGPMYEALGEQLGAIVFQFSPQGFARVRAPREFHAALAAFLRRLPRGPLYTIELRDREFLGADYEALLADVGAVHCASVHPRMPAVDEQVRFVPDRPLLVRWMLHPAQARYEAARERYAPFDRLVDPDMDNRDRIARLLLRCLESGQASFVLANNKAEGSAPLTLIALARRMSELAAKSPLAE